MSPREPRGPLRGRLGRAGLLLGILWMTAAGCVVTGAPAPTAAPPEGPTETMNEEELAELFVERARQLIDRGRVARAESYLDRAMNLRSENPRIWFQLARVRRRENRLHQAELLARKSLDLIEEDARLRIDNWRLIADVSRRRGDRETARRARRRLQKLGALPDRPEGSL